MADDSDVPPLEDMSEVINRAEALREYKHRQPEAETKHPVTEQAVHEKEKNKQTKPLKSTNAAPPSVNTKQVELQKSDKAFGGLKRGFLFGGPPSDKSKSQTASQDTAPTSKEDIPFIKPQQNKDEQFAIPEVQQAMNASKAFMDNKEWITPDILTQVQSNEVLRKRMTDPQFMQAIAEFQTNPNGAMSKYENNKEIMEFLQAFCGLMGQHFNKLADQQQPTPTSTQDQGDVQVHDAGTGADLSVRSSTNPKQATSADEARMQEILSNPEVKEILLDPRMMNLMDTLRNNPEEGQRVLQRAGGDLRKNIQKLVEVGLLQIQS